MSVLESEILHQFEEALITDKKVDPQLVHAVVEQLSAGKAPNSERIAEVLRRAASGGDLT